MCYFFNFLVLNPERPAPETDALTTRPPRRSLLPGAGMEQLREVTLKQSPSPGGQVCRWTVPPSQVTKV